MEIKTLVFSSLFIFLLGCKKQERLDPEENAKSYVSYSVDGKKYHLQHNSGSQYVDYFYGEEGGYPFPYKLAVAGRDSAGNAPSFLIAIRDKASVTKGVWKVSNDFHRTSDVVMSWIHLKTKNPLVYRAYWAFYDGTIEVTELTEHKIKGFFSGTVRTDPNSIIPSHESFKVTDGEFFVNRNPGYSIESRL
ncbi:hypothetical protein ACN9ML_07530 [Dyadobacter endophyticus]|uniref:hypothetical protein n=1 Tax=Dyadobacter endophyticus TaxID=1749036 RepID=UPI003CE7AFAF